MPKRGAAAPADPATKKRAVGTRPPPSSPVPSPATYSRGCPLSPPRPRPSSHHLIPLIKSKKHAV